jgi:hypothetical protein
MNRGPYTVDLVGSGYYVRTWQNGTNVITQRFELKREAQLVAALLNADHAAREQSRAIDEALALARKPVPRHRSVVARKPVPLDRY